MPLPGRLLASGRDIPMAAQDVNRGGVWTRGRPAFCDRSSHARVPPMLLSLVHLALATSPYDTLLGTAVTTAADEYAIGAGYIESTLWLSGRWEDAAQQARVERMTRRLTAASDRPDLIVNVVLLDDLEVNAAALPGGFLLINRGLLTLLDDDQLAFVIGHELSHVILRHGASTMNIKVASNSVLELQAARIGADRVAAESRAEDLYLMIAGHSRQLELEADLYGLLYSVRAGYPSAASVSALEAVDASVGGNVPEERRPWMSHPLTVDRVDQLQRGFAGIERVRDEFDAGLAYAAFGQYDQAVASFQQFLTLFPHSAGAWSNLAAAWLFQDPIDPAGWVDVLPMHPVSGVRIRGDAALKRERARDALARALQIDGADPTALTLAGVLARREGRLVEAQALLDRAEKAMPGSAAMMNNVGNVQADAGYGAVAMKWWTAAVAADPLQVEAQVNLARAYTRDPKGKKKAIAAWEALLDHPKWGAEASQQLDALGVRGPGPGGAAVATRTPGVVLDGRVFGLPLPLADAVAALGRPAPGEEAGENGFCVRGWEEHGLEALVSHDQVLAWFVQGDSTLTLPAGVGLGSTTEQVIAALGEPETRVSYGSVTRLGWETQGVAVRMVDGMVWQFSVQVPVR